MHRIYLSRRNLTTLLNKLDRVKAGGVSQCTIVKNDREHPKYPCSIAAFVTAVEDEDYYAEREPGEVLAVDLKPREVV